MSLKISTELLYINFIFVEDEVPEEDPQLVSEDVFQDTSAVIDLHMSADDLAELRALLPTLSVEEE